MDKSGFGKRLKQAFKNARNADIARKIGVSESAVNNYVNGRVPDLDKLLLIKSLTNCNLDWLLSGEETQNVEGTAAFYPGNAIAEKLQTVAAEQVQHAFADVEVAGSNINVMTLPLLVRYLLDRALLEHNLITEPTMSKADWKRAQKFSFVAERSPSIEEQIRDMVRREASGGKGGASEGLRDILRELVREEVDDSRKVPVYTIDLDKGKDKTRKAG